MSKYAAVPQTVHPRLTSVAPLPGLRLAFTLKGERGKRVADLTGVVASVAVLAPLADETVFARAAVVDWGVGVAWSPEDDPERLDLSAETLVRLARYQEPMTGAAFKAWRERLGLSQNETAELLGISQRTVNDYQAADRMPAVVAIACRALEADRHLLQAHFRPSAPAGRPRKERAAAAEAPRSARKVARRRRG